MKGKRDTRNHVVVSIEEATIFKGNKLILCVSPQNGTVLSLLCLSVTDLLTSLAAFLASPGYALVTLQVSTTTFNYIIKSCI